MKEKGMERGREYVRRLNIAEGEKKREGEQRGRTKRTEKGSVRRN